MYPSSSSSSHNSMGLIDHGGSGGGGGLTRYDSAPGSLLTTAIDSVIGPNQEFSQLSNNNPPPRYFSDTSSLTSESTCKTTTNNNKGSIDWDKDKSNGLQRSYGLNERAFLNNGSSSSPSSSSSLFRHSSSPAGFLNRLATAASADNGFSIARGIGSYNSKGPSDNAVGISRLNSQLSFTRQDSLSHITEESEDGDDDINADGRRKAAHSYATASFGMEMWDNSNTITFSAQPGKRAKTIGGDMVGDLNIIESQFQFGLSGTGLEMAAMEHMMEIPQDSVPCKARAKRGCATHPRSIAERERRTRISGKLKKLQDLVPNMDKQTSYADMLDFAVQHIKGLQNQVQKLNSELENCTCGCKQTT